MIVDCFAGPGGWDVGARLAGYTGPLVGIEWDHDACRTAMAAGHARVRADVAAFPFDRLVGKVDGVIQSPPCPTWSSAGNGAGKVDLPNVLRLIADHAAGREPAAYEWEDERSALTAQPMRWTAALRPRWVALEQVPAVLPVWQYMADRLRGIGYRAWTGVLSAEEYGVAQTRKRAVLIARLDGPALPPEPTHQAYRAGVDVIEHDDLFGSPLPPPVSMAEALGWGVDRLSWTVSGGGTGSGGGVEVFANAEARRQLNDAVAMRNGNQANACTRDLAEPAGTLFFGQRHNAVDWVLRNGPQANATDRRPDEPAATVYSQRTGNLAWVRSRPATTVCGDARIGRPGHKDRDKGEAQFAEDSVRVSVEEAGLLQSFPADYPWQGTSTRRYLQVGNAVPPLLAAAILRPLLADSSASLAA